MSTTDFEAWLEQASPDTTEEAYALYESVQSEEGNGFWEVTRRGDQLVLSIGHVEEALIIASESAKSTFLNLVRELYMDNTDDVESWYGYQRNMDNPKA